MAIRQDLILAQLQKLNRTSDLVRKEMMRMSVAPGQRKEPLVFSASRAADLLDKTPQSIGSVLKQMGRDIDPEAGRYEVDIGLISQLRTHYGSKPPLSGPARVLVVANQKGGVGKTTTVANLVPWLTLQGLRVLAIDADSQGSLTAYQGMVPDVEIDEQDTLSPILTGEVDPELGRPRTLRDLIRPCPHLPGSSFIPASLVLSNCDVDVMRKTFSGKDRGYLFYDRLYLAFEEIRHDYDVIVIDCPPHISPISWACSYAADMILVPCGAHALDLASTIRYVEWLEVTLSTLPYAALSRIRFLITNLDAQNSSRDVLQLIEQVLEPSILPAKANKSSEIQRANLLFKSIYECPRPLGSRAAYANACKSMDAVNEAILHELTHVTGYTADRRAADQASSTPVSEPQAARVNA